MPDAEENDRSVRRGQGRVCVECLGSENCESPEEPVCTNGGLCERCDPVNNNGCDGASAICAESPDGNRCVGCVADHDCVVAGVGQCVTENCAVCDPTDNAGCPPARPFCEADDNLNTCIECRADGDCGGDAAECVAGHCTTCDPLNHDGCEGERPFCEQGPDGSTACVACLGDGDCQDVESSECVAGDCVVCDLADNAGCDPNSDTPFCLDGSTGLGCYGCRDQADCTEPGLVRVLRVSVSDVIHSITKAA